MKIKILNLYANRVSLLNKNYKNFINMKTEEEIINFITKEINNPKIKEAILVNNYSLYKNIYKLKEYKKNLDNNRIIKSIRNYISSFSLRTTPFGLASSVGYSDFSSLIVKNIDDNFSVIKKVSVDLEWLNKLIRNIEKNILDIYNVKIYWNNLAIISGNKIKLLYSFKVEELQEKIKIIEYTEIIDYIITETSKGISFKKLVNKIFNKYNYNKEEIINFLNLLIYNEFIITDLSIDLINNDIFSNFIKKLENLKYSSKNMIDLKKLQLKILEINQNQNEFEEKIIEIIKIMKQIQKNTNYIKVDSIINSNESFLSRNIKKDILDLVNFLNKITPKEKERFTEIKKYINKFKEFYGNEEEILLLDLLDDSKGLGTPYKDRVNSVFDRDKENFKKIIIRKILKNLDKKFISLNLKDFYKYYKLNEFNFDEMELVFKINKKNCIQIISEKGTDKIGKIMGRFNYIFKDYVKKKLVKHYNNTYVEIVENLKNIKLQNIAQNYNFSKKILYVTNKKSGNNIVKLDNIAVGIENINDNDSFYFKDIENNERLIFNISNCLNYRNNKNISYISRFLLECSNYNKQNPFYFFRLLEEINDFPYIPEIRYKNIVLQPSKWIFDLEVENIDLSKDSKEKILKKFMNFSKKWGLTKKIIFKKDDLELYLNLNNIIDKKILIDEIIKYNKKNIILFSWDIKKENKEHNIEYICFLKNNFTKKNNFKSDLNKFENNKRYIPFDEWVYLKIYGINDRILEFLLKYLNDFISLNENKIKYFHYLIYYDDEKHIRLRFKFNKNLNNFNFLFDWLKKIEEDKVTKKIVFDTFFKEYKKYGGKENINYAIEIFYYDSKKTIKILKEIKENFNKRQAIILKSIIEMFFKLNIGLEEIFNIIDVKQDMKKYQNFKIKNKTFLKELLILKKPKNKYDFYQKIDKNKKNQIIKNIIHLHLNRLLVSIEEENDIYSYINLIIKDILFLKRENIYE